MKDALRSHLDERRAAAGLSLTELAARVGTSRQALSAIAAGRAVPSTALALRLAREVGCSVEELFSLAPAALDEVRVPELAGRRAILGRVGVPIV